MADFPSSSPLVTDRASTGNSSTTLLTAGSTFTGVWERPDAQSVTVAVSTDQDGTYYFQFSPDGVNVDSAPPRYYRTARINAPHRFTLARAYFRVVFTNTSASDQTYFRLQTIYGDKQPLNVPLDALMSQDYDATAVRPSDPHDEVALGLRQGSAQWNKWGYNLDVDAAATELIVSWGQAASSFAPLTSATTFTVVSDSAADDDGSTGANSIILYYIDGNRTAQTEVVTLDGANPVVTTGTGLGINRAAIYTVGSGGVNAGTITITATTGGTTQAQMPAGGGTTQQCIFFSQASHTLLLKWLYIEGIRFGSATEPKITVKAWVYSAISGTKYEVARLTLDLGVNTNRIWEPPIPFPVTESSAFWLEATTTRDDTQVNARFSLVEVRDNDA